MLDVAEGRVEQDVAETKPGQERLCVVCALGLAQSNRSVEVELKKHAGEEGRRPVIAAVFEGLGGESRLK